MIWNCGTDRDFNRWSQATGNQGWNYENILPYIKNLRIPWNRWEPNNHHKTTNADSALVPVLEAGFNELGYKTIKDYNSKQ